MIKNRFIKNTSWILFGQIVRLSISFVISIITARYLGPSNNGVINYINSYISFFTSLVGLGLNGVIIHEFVNHRDEEGKILGTAIGLRLIVGLLSALSFLGIVWMTDGNDPVIMSAAILQAIQLPFLCLDTVNFWYQSNMQSKYSVLAQTIAYLVTAAYKIYLLVAQKGVAWFSFAISLDFIILGVLYFVLYNRHKKQVMCYSAEVAKRLLKSGLPFILANIMIVIYGHMDRVMIKWLMESTREVGLYSAAITICSIISFIPSAILDSARPLIAEAKNESEEKYNLRFRQLVAGIMWISFLYSIFITVFSKLIIYLMYGSEYLDANICMKIAVWYTAFSFIGSAKDFWLICEDKKRYVFIFSAIGAGCNVIMNLVFIPWWGINGAAIATLITQILANFIIPFVFKETRQYSKYVLNAIFLRNLQLKNAFDQIKRKYL